jgi:cobalt-zinc-cadmium efflux system outer membrane protein
LTVDKGLTLARGTESGMLLRRWTAALLASTILVAAGCMHAHAVRDDRSVVIGEVRDRAGKLFVPDTVNLADGLSEGEAVQLALCNNAAFQELLTDLGLAHADLVQAGLLPNPEALYVVQTGVKPYKWLFDYPVEAIWLRPRRVAAAAAEWERARERLVQAGLDLARDTRLAYADWALARERVRITDENRRLRERLTELTGDRLARGDATPLEVSTARIDSLRARQEATRAANDLPIFEERLRNLIGLGAARHDLNPQASEPPGEAPADVAALAAEAVATRPDIRSAERLVEAAEARLRLARLSWFRLLAIEDATSGHNGHEPSPGFRMTLPILNWNQGAIGRAEGERDRAARGVETVRQRIIQEVRVAHAEYVQAAADYREWMREINPAVAEAIRRAEATYKAGGASLVLVLETSRQQIDARVREAQLRADMLKAWAELERAVGRRLEPGTGFATERGP